MGLPGRSGRSAVDQTATTVDRRLTAGRRRSCTPLARELAEHERLGRFAAALPDTRARVSEAALPLFAAALYEHLDRRLVVRRCPTTPTRATRPRRPAGTSVPSGSASCRAAASAGSRGSSRRRTSSASGRARSTCSPAAGSSSRRRWRSQRARRRPPRARRRSTIRIGDEPGVDGLAEALALAGYERVEQAEERGQFAVRGGIVDVFPSTGREPLRIELFGDEIESIRAFSPFTQRALHAVDEALVYPAAERRPDLGEPRLADDEDGRPHRAPDDLVPLLDVPAGPRLAGRRGARGRARGARRRARARHGRAARPAPAEPAVRVRGAAAGDRGARPLRGGARAREPRARRPARDRRLPAPRRGAPHPGDAAPRPGRAASTTRAGCRARPGLAFVVAPARRGFVWRELGLALLPDTQVFRKRPPRADARLGRALQSFADLRTGDYVVHEDHGVGRLLVVRDARGRRASRATTCCSPSAARTGSTSRTSRSARSRATSAPTRARRRSRSSAARRGSWSRTARARASASSPASCSRSTRSGRAPRASPYDLENEWLRAARGRVPLPRDRGPGARDRGRQGGPRGAAADGPPRLRRRRLRQDRGRRARRVRRRDQRPPDADARADDDPRAAALEHLPRALPRLPAARRDGLALPQAGRGQARARATSPRARSTS